MPLSTYVRSLRERVGHDLLLLPGVTAIIRQDDRFLLARQRDTERWSLVGGGIEPGETPQEAIIREVAEELGVIPTLGRIVGAYGGHALESTLPNGDQVAYTTIAFECHLPGAALTLEDAELLEARWFAIPEVRALDRHDWIDHVLIDASA
jgi:8-oxo-dGTP pyrophosphatase MutT (NUDIX family)